MSFAKTYMAVFFSAAYGYASHLISYCFRARGRKGWRKSVDFQRMSRNQTADKYLNGSKSYGFFEKGLPT